MVMSENTLELALARRLELQNGMELILGKLRHDAKSITTEDARSLADNAEDGDEQTEIIIAAIEDIAARNKAHRAVNDDHARSFRRHSQPTSSVSQDFMQRLRSDPSSIAEEDARRFSDNVEARDASPACIISAVESLAVLHNDICGKVNTGVHDAHPSLLTVVKDLFAAVETNPGDVDMEILMTTQSIVSKMQKAVGHINAPHPELEAELQQEYARIVPKVERSVVIKAEADNLHSLEARAYGQTERGELTAKAQSIAARRERQTSFGSSSSNIRSRANSRAFTPHKQSHQNPDVDHFKSETEGMGAQNSCIIKQNRGDVHVGEHRSPENDNMPAAMRSMTSMRHYQSLSDSTNTPRASIEENREKSSMTSKLVGISVHDKEDGEFIFSTPFLELKSYGSGDDNSGGLGNIPSRTQAREQSKSDLIRGI